MRPVFPILIKSFKIALQKILELPTKYLYQSLKVTFPTSVAERDQINWMNFQSRTMFRKPRPLYTRKHTWHIRWYSPSSGWMPKSPDASIGMLPNQQFAWCKNILWPRKRKLAEMFCNRQWKTEQVNQFRLTNKTKFSTVATCK